MQHLAIIASGNHAAVGHVYHLLLQAVSIMWRKNPVPAHHPLTWVQCTLSSGHHKGGCLRIVISARGLHASWSR